MIARLTNILQYFVWNFDYSKILGVVFPWKQELKNMGDNNNLSKVITTANF